MNSNTQITYVTSPHRKKSTNRKRLSENGGTAQDFGPQSKVAIYVRVSSEEQIDGYSLDAQENKCKEFAASRQWIVYKVYIDAGVSAKNDKRPEFQKLITDAEKGKFKAILVHKLDRFSRSITDISNYFTRLSDNNVMLTSVTEQFDFASPHGRMFFHMMAVMAQWYLENLSSEAIKAKEQMFREGRQGSLPFGYIREKETKTPMIVPEEARVIKQAFELYATGNYSDRLVAQYLNSTGIKTRKGRTWSKDTIRDLLRNEFYYGMVAHREKLNQGVHDAIISKDLYDRCMKIRKGHATRPRASRKENSYYLLNKVASCVLCSRKLRVSHGNGKPYLREVSKERGLECKMAYRSISMNKADEQIIDVMKKIHLPENWKEEIKKRATDPEKIEELKKQKQFLKEKILRIGNVYTDGGMSREDYKIKLKYLQEELKGLVISDQKSLISKGEIIENMEYYLEHASKKELSNITHLIFEDVQFDLSEKRLIKFKPHKDFLELFCIVPSTWLKDDVSNYFIIR
ncbi:MAG: recombinase family protein [Anaerolineaceae bacterium]|nr:recombinase family protein [Anaerolineaceae bacterium]